MGGWPKDPDAKKVIRTLEDEFGWIYSTDTGKSAHAAGHLMCGAGCRHAVWSTSKKGTANVLWSLARKCDHGHAPDRRHW